MDEACRTNTYRSHNSKQTALFPSSVSEAHRRPASTTTSAAPVCGLESANISAVGDSDTSSRCQGGGTHLLLLLPPHRTPGYMARGWENDRSSSSCTKEFLKLSLLTSQNYFDSIEAFLLALHWCTGRRNCLQMSQIYICSSTEICRAAASCSSCSSRMEFDNPAAGGQWGSQNNSDSDFR